MWIDAHDVGSRTVEIAPTTVAVLRAYRASQLEKRMKAGELWDADLNLFFSNDTGGVLDGVAITKAFQKLAAAASLEPLRFHDLRHTCVSLLLAAGVKMDEHSRPGGPQLDYDHRERLRPPHRRDRLDGCNHGRDPDPCQRRRGRMVSKRLAGQIRGSKKYAAWRGKLA